jgi:ABC-type sulfate/molybdate transport systems ATPase subunit
MSIGCRSLRVAIRGRELLTVDTLEVADGETLAVLGPNGAGKSTLLRALAGLGPAGTIGQVLLDGHPAAQNQLRGAVAGTLQRPILQRTTVLDNAAAGLRLRGVRRANARTLAEPWLDKLGVGHLAGRQARSLSGGEAQRVAIARALAVRPRVLLLDEPFAGLDATTRADLLADLRAALNQSGAAVVLVTHDRDEAAALAHRTALLIGGRIRQLDTTDRVLDLPADPDCAALLGYTTRLPPALTGHDVLLVARPERCELLLPGALPPSRAVVVSGTVTRVVPLGGTARVDIATATGPIAVHTTTDVTARPGDSVRVSVDADSTRECPPRCSPLHHSDASKQPSGKDHPAGCSADRGLH